jgi:hypothetical protein
MTKQERELAIEEHRWQRKKELLERKYKLRQEKKEFKKQFLPKISTSKLLILFLFINCTIIELFTGFVTLKSLDLTALTMTTPDFTPLVALIGAVVSEVVGYAVYAIKSAKENTAGGIVYETAMMNCPVNDRPEEPVIDPIQDSVG